MVVVDVFAFEILIEMSESFSVLLEVCSGYQQRSCSEYQCVKFVATYHVDGYVEHIS
jgi:hypothetical protein